MKKIAIIPARSGSKGLKDKNIKKLCGKPLISYSIEAALQSGLFEEVITSTDSKEYGKIAEKFGSKVYYRGEELSNDSASTFMVIEDVLEKYNKTVDYFVLLQPTSPMRDYKHIKIAINMFEENFDKYDSLVSVKEAEMASILVKPLGKNNGLNYFDADFANYRRQKYKEYSPNGAIFIGKPQAYKKTKHFFGKKGIAYIMSKKDSIDIDDEIDFKLATLIMKEKKNGKI